MTGVYKITNLINKDCYIGSSIEVNERWKRHKYLYNKKGIHYDYYIYRAFRKYGLNSFDFVVLEECKAHELIEKETYYFHFYEPEYNLIVPNQNPAHNKEVKKRISASNSLVWEEKNIDEKQIILDNLIIGHSSEGSNKFPPKKICATEIESGKIYEFNSMYEAEKEIGVQRSSISQILNEKHPRKKSKGYTFKYSE